VCVVFMYVYRMVCGCVCGGVDVFVYAQNFVTNTGAVALNGVCFCMDVFLCGYVCIGWYVGVCVCMDVFVRRLCMCIGG